MEILALYHNRIVDVVLNFSYAYNHVRIYNDIYSVLRKHLKTKRKEEEYNNNNNNNKIKIAI